MEANGSQQQTDSAGGLEEGKAGSAGGSSVGDSGSVLGLASRCVALSWASGIKGGGFKMPGLGGMKKDVAVAGKEVAGGLGGGKKGGSGDREGVGVGGFGELGVVVAEGGGGSGLAHGGVSKSCLCSNGEWVWNWRGGPARIELNVWGGVWDVGWNRRRRMGPKVMVRGEYEGSGGPPGPIG